MDDMKKAIYLEARCRIENGSEFLCNALLRAICSVTGLPIPDGNDYSLIKCILPEFYELDDGKFWFKRAITRKWLYRGEGEQEAWWEANWPEPRLAVIDFLLENR